MPLHPVSQFSPDDPPRSLPQLLRDQARHRPDAPLLLYGDRVETYADFDRRTDELAVGLSGLGVHAGDVVAVFMTNRPEYLLAWWAVLKLGASVVHVNPAYTGPEAFYVIDHAQAILVIADENTAPVLRKIRPRLPAVRQIVITDHTDPGADMIGLQTLYEAGGPAAEVEVEPQDLAGLVYTSGTTGTPKGAMLTHGSYLANAAMLAEVLPVRAEDRLGLVLPLFHANAQVVSTITPILMGATIALWPGRFSASTFWDNVARYQPITFSAVPTMLAGLLRAPGADTVDTGSLRFVLCGAAPLSVELLTTFESRFGVQILEGYGLTEATCALSVNPFDGDRKTGSVGLPLRGAQVRVVDEHGHPVPDGQIGEFIAHAPSLMAGYHRDEQATAQTLRQGWLYTGDVGYRDGDGYLFLVDRKKDMIIQGGENIYPAEVEQAINAHPAVAESAVIGVPHPALGQQIHAVVVPDEGHPAPTSEQILAHCSTRLATYKLPSSIEFRADLPKTVTGKIQRSKVSPT